MYLLITLGHNSSAIGFTNDKEIITGYEEERFTRKKSENQFPINSIKKVFEYHHPNKNERNIILVSHWYDNFDFWKKEIEEIKRWDYKFIESLVLEFNFEIFGLTEGFTHHDAHAYSSLVFLNSYRKGLENVHFIVVDGFGNNQEVISIYEKEGEYLKKIKTISGYYNSLGLFYQYATSFCGMKENQDEYKFLGYEIYIDEVLNDKELETINRKIARMTEQFFHKYEFVTSETYINVEALNDLKSVWHLIFNSIVGEGRTEHQKRIIIGYLVQSVIEEVMVKIIEPYKNVVLSGGLFYNVKLNNRIAKHVDTICVMPICGDQGAAIGMFGSSIGDFKFNDLLWGKRDLENTYDDETILIDKIVMDLEDNKIVNLVSGNMEFGPRALCNTTTLALPFQKNVELINKMNNRSTIMPMAPVMLKENLDYFFNKEDYEKVIGSLEYMIVTLDYKDNNLDEFYDGIMHKYPLEEKYSGRPQVVTDENSIIYKVLKRMEPDWKALINTSFNIHGMPIVNTMEDAMTDYEYQLHNTHKTIKLYTHGK